MNDRYRVVERPWDIERRRYAVEALRAEIQGEEIWGVEGFFATPLDAQLFLSKFKKGPRVISEIP